MAGGNAKKVAAHNASSVKTLRLGFLASHVVYLLHLVLFRSGRSWGRIFRFGVTDGVALALWYQLEQMALEGADLAQPGLTTYMFDVIYITWLTHIVAALITTKGWYLYLLIPGYAIYKAASIALPILRPSGGGAAGAGAAGQEAPAAESKRQQKLKARAAKGDPRIRMQQR